MNEEKAIEDIFTTYVETRRRNDMGAWGALFAGDADAVTHAGVWWKSNRENVEGHKRSRRRWSGRWPITVCGVPKSAFRSLASRPCMRFGNGRDSFSRPAKNPLTARGSSRWA